MTTPANFAQIGVPRPVIISVYWDAHETALLLDTISLNGWIISLTNLRGLWKCEIEWRLDMRHSDKINDCLKFLGTDAEAITANGALVIAWRDMQEQLKEFWCNADAAELNTNYLESLRGQPPQLGLIK